MQTWCTHIHFFEPVAAVLPFVRKPVFSKHNYVYVTWQFFPVRRWSNHKNFPFSPHDSCTSQFASVLTALYFYNPLTFSQWTVNPCTLPIFHVTSTWPWYNWSSELLYSRGWGHLKSLTSSRPSGIGWSPEVQRPAAASWAPKRLPWSVDLFLVVVVLETNPIYFLF